MLRSEFKSRWNLHIFPMPVIFLFAPEDFGVPLPSYMYTNNCVLFFIYAWYKQSASYKSLFIGVQRLDCLHGALVNAQDLQPRYRHEISK